ncbi:hypothetical protein VTN02DRAFT_1217 [Thermoascus thermophilus]
MTASGRPQTRRQPLTDATSRVNNCPSTRAQDDVERRQDQLKIANGISESPENRHISAVIDALGDSNRNSTISAASTTSGKGRRKTHVGPWQLGRTLGKGATGRVRLAKHAVTGQSAAIKIVSKKSAAMVQSESIAAMDRNAGLLTGAPGARPMPFGIEREVVIMKLIEHPNVINLYDVWENRGELYLVLEYVEGGELFDYVSANGPLPEEEAVRLFRQIIAGLSYCHRFNICHRDLKPENILLDAKHNIKLADFGMAALQPAGHWLNTSCGSPHYAAPEIIYGRRYRGDKADIWSCGIILFALLTGFLPFDGGDLSNTLRLVKKGDYVLPPWLSAEAIDLIQRILQKRPEDRIAMQDIWLHPLLKKYEKLHQAMADHPVGPPPPLSVKDCGPPVASRFDIDMELLRSLQTLWHGVKPESLIERLLSNEPSHERMFYNALIKFRDEQLENYQGHLEYSASDYHHISRPAARAGTKRMQSRRRSQFSIITDGSRCSISGKENKTPRPVESYDQYRSSRNTITHPDAEYANVTIHGTSDGKCPMHESSDECACNPTVDGVHSDEDPFKATPPPEPPRSKKPKLISAARSYQSRSSLASSRRGFSPSPAVRSASYKRNVSFRHIRKRSQGAASVKSKAAQPNTPNGKSHTNTRCSRVPQGEMLSSDRHSSPALPTPPAVVRAGRLCTELDLKKVQDASMAWKEEARKISNELSQICEEAFNRSSVSTGRTGETSFYNEPLSPPTSISVPDDPEQSVTSAKNINRSLADTPKDYLGSSTIRDLAETRRKLIEHSTKEGSEGLPGYLTEVISHLDRLIEQDQGRQARRADQNDPNKRAISDPMPNSGAGYLPAISEELLAPTDDATGLRLKYPDQRISSEPTGRKKTKPSDYKGKPTIRMVTGDSLTSIAEVPPLNIRKKNHLPPLINGAGRRSAEELRSSSSNGNSGGTGRHASAGSRHPRFYFGLEPIEESPNSPRRPEIRTAAESKKFLWFNKPKSQAYEQRQKDVQPIHPSNGTVVAHEVDPPADDETKNVNRKQSVEKTKGAFLNLFSKKKAEKPSHDLPAAVNEMAETESDVASTLVSEASTQNAPQHKECQKSGSAGSHNWFARFFHLKPATRVIALKISKVKARKEVYRVLRDWKQYGVEELHLDKERSVIYGRVGDANFLRLRPVEFSAEFYTILEHGRHANLSLIRFRQERGAASSFHKVVETLHMVLKQRDLVVEDPARAKKMAKVLDPLR